jgi:hypothetical protein
VLAALLAVALAASVWSRPAHGSAEARPRDVGMWLVVALAILFRLPMAGQGAAAYVTADGALSGLMALDVRDGRAHDVFVPHVPYSGRPEGDPHGASRRRDRSRAGVRARLRFVLRRLRGLPCTAWPPRRTPHGRRARPRREVSRPASTPGFPPPS